MALRYYSLHPSGIVVAYRDIADEFMLFSNFVYAGTVVTVWCRHVGRAVPVKTYRARP